ncbi:bcl-2 homologous antagonist/killer isoform X2 [Dipodomys spectabilis]|uniref:bcl-2 homologous antagonist/killer isoform X2 n=1 Tax=Dipodomys spectabilis TaxID=105255 RepID=UPI001C547C48|nr:bcl-2 homologous antagonist/killer isoform X2 [Dipodomys spectabilis]
MASGQGPGPPRESCEEPSSSSASEQQVAQDTEEVFRSYVYYSHQQEQEAQGAAAPLDPEMVNLPQDPNSVMGQVGRQLAIIGDDINRRFDSEFQNMLQQLQPTAENAPELFAKIASRPAATPTGNPPAASVHFLYPLPLCLCVPAALDPRTSSVSCFCLLAFCFHRNPCSPKLRPGLGQSLLPGIPA